MKSFRLDPKSGVPYYRQIIDQIRYAIYTGELRPTTRVYRCRCGEEIDVGSTKKFTTVEELKARGCPRCGRREGFRLAERQRV